MKNIFTRMKESISSDLHNMLDQKQQKNPIAALNYYLRQSEEETERVRKLVERQHLLKEQLVREYKLAESMKEKRQQQAEVALQAQENDLYEFVQKEHAQYEERTERLNVSIQHVTKQLDELERKYEEMKHKLKDMHIRRMELMGRENVARANHRMNTILNNDELASDEYSKFSDIERYIDQLENQINTDYYRQTIDSKIAALQKEAK
ncbi:modulator protein [Priestia aryabhattai]|uniref:PspA/IM30 family protein n=1 Tax=Bacillaceae TaxID=186817 RepID=UPI000BA0E4AE|nr:MULTISPECIES: PspA/IM30 family protein [Bacillaceae]MDT2047411.1 PspA/IM30 family protein [Priestia flexa]OZT14039.1 modulator protein [Priestia aryabhattai]TDB55155.1 PspA/IM30 family protein [Bacillus sp. CBEL-1]